ncbi:MAG: pyruvate dehydrogenase complex dihydrolipoamide acetyltransferase [Rhodospirillaceae bacterium]|nr:pyruvate dehydrogenase complex dihydrolipoamide acetyltransferase [Rhodospirillaceae bacterium]
MPIQILMPALSPTMTEGTLSKWMVKEGDEVTSGDIIAEIETDKATMELEAVDEGKVGKILVPEGTEGVAINKPIVVLLEEGEDAGDIKASNQAAPILEKLAPTVEPEKVKAAPAAQPTAAASNTVAPSSDGDRMFASPLARRIAANAGINIADVQGSGPNGRIVKADVEKAMSGGVMTSSSVNVPAMTAVSSASADVPDFGQPYTEEVNSGVRKIIARRLLEAKQNIPHFYLTIDCNIDALLSLRRQLNNLDHADYNLSVNDFVIKASAVAMRRVPMVNATWTDEAIRLYDNVDVAVAVATDGGLITPILRHADQKGLSGISNEMKELAGRARGNKLKPDEYQGGGFSISNLGMFGIKEFSAIVNPPQSAILAVGAGEQRPIVKDGVLAVGTVMTCTLSCDHRVVDGVVGAEFLAAFKPLIENPLSLLL